MTSLRSSPKIAGFVAVGAIAAVTLAGCAGSAHLARAGTYGEREASRAEHQASRSMVSAEKSVARSPRNAVLRSRLGLAYLEAGRFELAATALDDAMKLGDGSPRTALSLALAMIGAGRGREAIAILDSRRDGIPASDLGLALALAGETSRGVAILTDALRGGENSVKLRQNLAFAFALDGRWREARTMMEQDLPADQIDSRISAWAMQGRAEDYQKRVAGLLGAPVRSDPGMPQRLALGDPAPVEQIAAQTTPPAPQWPVPATAELPAAGEAQPPETPSPAVPFAAANEPPAMPYAAPPAVALAPQPAPQPIDNRAFASAFDAPPVPVQPFADTRRDRHPAPRAPRIVQPAPNPVSARKGSHLVQLGSFASPEGARRAAGIFTARNPVLRQYRMVITPAVVRGRNFWRVAVAGFTANTASGMCHSIKYRGGACFAYAAARAPAGALPVPEQGVAGPQRARR